MPQSQPERFEERKNLLLIPGLPDPSPVTILTRLLGSSFKFNFIFLRQIILLLIVKRCKVKSYLSMTQRHIGEQTINSTYSYPGNQMQMYGKLLALATLLPGKNPNTHW